MTESVPLNDNQLTILLLDQATSPYSLSWWTDQVITDIPYESVGWLVAQGWQITSIRYDTTTTPPTPYYTMQRQSLQNWLILQSLLESYTIAYNEARELNSIRYNDILVSWHNMLHGSHEQFDQQVTEQNAHVTLYLGNLEVYMDEVSRLIQEAQDKIDLLEAEYQSHAEKSPAYLTDLGATELARINEQFAATLATQLQQLTDRGMYSSAIVTDITARNERDRDEQIQALNDRLNREKLANDHQLYEQLVQLRVRLSESRNQAIVQRMNEANARLAGLAGKHEENMRLMAYQLDERNKLLIGIYAFVERREDVGPRFEDLTKICTSLGDAGGGWVTP
jgi:hypothetical protein